MDRRYKNGLDRDQAMLLPPRVADYVSADNPVRAIDAFVDSLDLAELGFQHAQDQSAAASRRMPRRHC